MFLITWLRAVICGRLNQRRWAAKTTLCRFQFNNINYKILQSHSIWIMLFAGLECLCLCVCLYARYPTICAIKTNLAVEWYDVDECEGIYQYLQSPQFSEKVWARASNNDSRKKKKNKTPHNTSKMSVVNLLIWLIFVRRSDGSRVYHTDFGESLRI